MNSRAKRRVIDLVGQISPRWLLVPVVLIVVALGTLGVIDNGDTASTFNMERELMPAAIWSWFVLAASGSLYIAGRHLSNGRHTAWFVLGLFLCWMSLDELTVIHEHVETLTGVDWQLMYVPIVIPGAVAAIVVLRELYETRRLSAILFATGIVCWVVSQLFEHLEWSSGTEPIHPGLIPPEEVLEMTGSALFGFAALLAVRKLLADRDSGAVV